METMGTMQTVGIVVGIIIGALTIIGAIFSVGVNWGKMSVISDRLNAHSIRIKETEERLRAVEQAFAVLIEIKELLKELLKRGI